jgi:hypothetical protein
MADQEEEVRVVTTTARLRPRRSRRVKLKNVASNNVPQDVHSDDAINIISLLAETKFIDIDEEEDLKFNFLLKTRYEVNKKGRLIELTLGLQQLEFWNVPKDILRFNLLVKLNLCKCGRLPDQFEFPNLKKLLFFKCGDQLNCQSTTIKLPKLTYLALSECKLSSSNISSLISFISELPQLDFLYFDKIITNDGCSNIDPILQILQNEALPSNRLHSLVINGVNLTGIQLKRLLLEVLPRHTKLRVLNLRDNHIESLQHIVDGINEMSSGQILPSRTTSIFNNHITHVLLDDNPVVENIKKDDKEKKALLTCLRYYKRVYKILSKPLWSHPFDTEIVYALRMNEAGRILLVDGGTGTSGNTYNLPLSVWPTILIRAFGRSQSYTRKIRSFERSLIFTLNPKKNDVSVVYDLLRNGPIIQAIADPRRGVNNNSSNNKRKRKGKFPSDSSMSSGSPPRRSRRLRLNVE